MAKKRRGKTEEEEDFDFKLPKFDEGKFIQKEKRNIKTLYISFAFGILIAALSFGFWALLIDSGVRWELVFLFGIFNASWLKYLFTHFNIDLTDFGRKNWFSSYAIYFFTWLLIFIVLVNPPFYDDEPPIVEAIALPAIQEPGSPVKIVARIIDNTKISTGDINFTLVYPNQTIHYPDFTYNDTIITYVYDNTENLTGEYRFIISATDVNGHNRKINHTFRYDTDAIKLALPAAATTPPGPLVTYAQNIEFDVEPSVSRVYYTIDGGKEINATMEEEFYETFPKFEGWKRNDNVTMRVYAEIIHYFKNLNRAFRNTINDSSTYYFQTTNGDIGEDEPPEIRLPTYKPVQVPGFEILIFIISLIIVVLILKYSRKDKNA
jgi:hypothetical protein